MKQYLVKKEISVSVIAETSDQALEKVDAVINRMPNKCIAMHWTSETLSINAIRRLDKCNTAHCPDIIGRTREPRLCRYSFGESNNLFCSR